MEQQQRQRHFNLFHYHVSQQQTTPLPALPSLPILVSQDALQPTLELEAQQQQMQQPVNEIEQRTEGTTETVKQQSLRPRLLAIALVLVLGITVYFIWRPDASGASTPTTSNTPVPHSTAIVKSSVTPSAAGTDGSGTAGTIQVYIAGAVQHPGVYSLNSNARVYELLKMAGGPLPSANLVALNLAARLNDGQEVYVAAIGENPPSSLSNTNATSSAGSTITDPGQKVNINKASADEMRQTLHVSSKTAQDIVTYRQKHGPFNSIEALQQVVSKAIYTKIKDLVTI